MATAIAIPKNVFYSSILIAIVSMIFLFPFGVTVPLVQWLADVGYAFDIAQMLSFFFIILLLNSWLQNSHTRILDRLKYLLLAALGLLIFFCIEQLFVGDSIATGFFARQKLTARLPEPYLTQTVMNMAQNLFGRAFSANVLNSTPSDFALRQWTITILGLFFLDQPQMKLSSFKKNLSRIILFSALIYLSFARVVRLQHTPLDIAVSLGFGIILVWPLLFLAAEATNNPPGTDIYYSFVFAYLVIFGGFVTIANSPNWPTAWLFLLLFAPAFFAVRFGLLRILRYERLRNGGSKL
jgi:hypothetical protein